MLRRPIIASMVVLVAACDGTPTEEKESAPNGKVVWSACAAWQAPDWFAVQNGNQPWTRVNAVNGGTTFGFVLDQPTAGIAYHDDFAGLVIVYGTPEELKSLAPSCAGARRSVSGTVTGYTAPDGFELRLGLGPTIGASDGRAAPAPVNLIDVEADATTAVAVRYRAASGGGGMFQRVPDNILIHRGVTGTSLGSLDFNSATEGGPPIVRTASFSVAIGDQIEITSTLFGPRTQAPLSSYSASMLSSGNRTVSLYGLPGSRLGTGESQFLRFSNNRPVLPNTANERFIGKAFTEPVDQVLTLGPVLGSVVVTGTSRGSAAYTIQPEYDRAWSFTMVQWSPETVRVTMYQTVSYAETSTGTVALTVPDLSAVSGFSSSWLPVPANSDWAFTASSSFAGLAGRPVTFQAAERRVYTP